MNEKNSWPLEIEYGHICHGMATVGNTAEARKTECQQSQCENMVNASKCEWKSQKISFLGQETPKMVTLNMFETSANIGTRNLSMQYLFETFVNCNWFRHDHVSAEVI